MFRKKFFFILPLLFLATACVNPVAAPVDEAPAAVPASQDEARTSEDGTARATLTVLSDDQQFAFFNEYLPVEEGQTLLSLMQGLAEAGRLQMEAKGEGEMAFVEGLYGIKGDAATNRYWMFYVNNELAKVGAGSYAIQDGDAIEWRYIDTSKVEF